jgi:hypothetical protein
MNVKPAGTAPGHGAPAPAHFKDPWLISADDFPAEATSEEKLWFAVSYAVLAPSTHNTQPWRFRIHGMEVDLYADRTRALPVVDPQGRELTISCGAALFHLRLALQYFGYAPTAELLPDPADPDLLARVNLGLRAETDSDVIVLFQAITQRHTNRQAFRSDPVAHELLLEFANAAQSQGAWLQIVGDEPARSALADLIAEADRRQWADKHFRQELAAWVRPPDSARRDGLAVATQDLGSLMSHAGPLIIRTFDLGKGHAAKDRQIALYSPVLALLGTDADDVPSWLAAGQGLARVLLEVQAEGVSASFLNQPIQVPELRPAVSQIAGRGGFPQILLRLGYGEPVQAACRRPVADVLIAHHAPGTA